MLRLSLCLSFSTFFWLWFFCPPFFFIFFSLLWNLLDVLKREGIVMKTVTLIDGHFSLDPIVLWRNSRSILDAFCLISWVTHWCYLFLSSLSTTWEAWQHWSTCANLLGKLSPLYVSSNAIRYLTCCKEVCLSAPKDLSLYRSVSPVGDFQMTLYFRSHNS